jgi:hypothetical protein
MAEEKMTFQQFFESFGSQLLAGWLRARNDGNEEEFEHWVLGEYSVYMDVDKDMAELDDSGDDDDYEVPYHGIADSPAPAVQGQYYARRVIISSIKGVQRD